MLLKNIEHSVAKDGRKVKDSNSVAKDGGRQVQRTKS